MPQKKQSKKELIKKGALYYPPKEFQEQANVKGKSVYVKALLNPVKFWETLAKELQWQKKWQKGFEHHPPYFKWFEGGKINITENCLDRHIVSHRDSAGPEVKTRKNKIAFIWEPEPLEEAPRQFTYYQLFKEVNRFANGLKKLGVRKGDRVGIYLPMIPEVIISMLACARIGAVHSVVFSAFSAHALQIRLQDTKAKVLITADGYYRRGEIIDLKKKADEGVKQTNVQKVVVVKRAGNSVSLTRGRDVWFEDVVRGQPDICQAREMDSEDPLFILYTSGSTGKPKGCVHTCGGYTVQAYVTGRWIFDLKDSDIFWSTSDMGWITGHTYSCYAPLLNGATFLLFEGAPDWPEPDRWAKIIEKYGVTIFYTAPTAVRMFEKYGKKWLEPYKFETLRLLGSVGEPIDEAAWQWYFREVGKKRCPLVDTWWQTETGGILITSLPGIGPFKPSFAGLPFPGIKVDILAPPQNQDAAKSKALKSRQRVFSESEAKSLPANKEGNLVLLPPFAPGLLRNVWQNPKKYKETYWSQYGNKIYFTSDTAFRDRKGLIRIVGRADDVIKVAGHRITTGELESAITLHPDITEVAVIGMPDPIKGEVPAAFVILKTQKTLQEIEKAVKNQIMKEIGPIALPKKIFIVSDLPKTRSGKIMRRILKRLFTGEDLGDLSTLANPQSVEELRKIVQPAK